MDRTRAEAFQVLGIPVDSDADAVLHAFRRLARVTHPDVSADPQAGDRFASLAAAYRFASQAAAGAGSSASADRSGLRGSVPSRPMSWGSTPRRRRPHDAPIVAGPVFISPARRTGDEQAGQGEVRGG